MAQERRELNARARTHNRQSGFVPDRVVNSSSRNLGRSKPSGITPVHRNPRRVRVRRVPSGRRSVVRRFVARFRRAGLWASQWIRVAAFATSIAFAQAHADAKEKRGMMSVLRCYAVAWMFMICGVMTFLWGNSQVVVVSRWFLMAGASVVTVHQIAKNYNERFNHMSDSKDQDA